MVDVTSTSLRANRPSLLNHRYLRSACFTIVLFCPRPSWGADIEIAGSPDQQQQVRQSLVACPSLATALEQLAGKGTFSRIRVAPPQEVARTGPFSAAISGPEIIITAQWLADQKIPYFDVRTPNEILPDNLCFGLGHLADHLTHPVTPQPTMSLETWMSTKLRSEGTAFLAGWAYVREAALARNGGKALSGPQVGALILNLRYRFAFLKAMDKQAKPQLRIDAGGSIPPDDSNVAAIAEAVKNSSVADLQ